MGGYKFETNNAETFESGNYFPCVAATYVLEVSRVLTKTNRKKKDIFVAEFRVIESSNKDPEKQELGLTEGLTGSWVVNLESDYAMSDLKSFALAALGFSKNDPKRNEQDTDKALGLACTDGAFEGIKVCLETSPHTTKAKTMFTKHMWSPGPEAS
jgi:hypothetical protein